MLEGVQSTPSMKMWFHQVKKKETKDEKIARLEAEVESLKKDIGWMKEQQFRKDFPHPFMKDFNGKPFS